MARPGRQEADPEQRETVITQLVANRTILAAARGPVRRTVRPDMRRYPRISQ